MQLVLILSAGQISTAADELTNGKLKVIISPAGKLLSVEDREVSQKYAFESDEFELDTDRGIFLTETPNRPKAPTA